MINFKTITQGVETVLGDNLTGYIITRNAERNEDPSLATGESVSGWIGIYRGQVDYEAHSIGSTPWKALLEVIVEVQAASFLSGDDAEDRLQDAEKAVLDVLASNKTLNGTVDMTNGYSIDYEYNYQGKEVYFHSAIITIKAEART